MTPFDPWLSALFFLIFIKKGFRLEEFIPHSSCKLLSFEKLFFSLLLAHQIKYAEDPPTRPSVARRGPGLRPGRGPAHKGVAEQSGVPGG